MATLNSLKRNTSGQLDAGYMAEARVLDLTFEFGVDATMTTATDDINLATLPGGVMVVGGSVQQLTPGTGTGTVVLRVGTTTISGTLVATDAAGTVAATVPAAIPLVVPAAGAELNLLGATATRAAGRVRAIVLVVEGDRSPRVPVVAARDVV
jgi:hypothetical protein